MCEVKQWQKDDDKALSSDENCFDEHPAMMQLIEREIKETIWGWGRERALSLAEEFSSFSYTMPELEDCRREASLSMSTYPLLSSETFVEEGRKKR